MKKTYTPKTEDIKRKWYIVDAKGQILGRLAAKVASVLRGKHKAIFTPHLDTGDGVIVINASQIKVTGRKLRQKVYRRYSGYPGGQREVKLEDMLAKKPATVIRLAVERMLPINPLGRDMIKKLRVFSDDKHDLTGVKPQVLEVKK
ncbi:MAG: 50S ribosomal protein L13 [Candidatus Omnitrophica bacterium]|jgi:large subunit ribosomal protein L13|nr:50S ribosomal protein L13 [Candidatus Omnitrophota bacterium]MDD3274208.1 50S ribosomal protein L13 [Candidatus Omnitrophota bacterium]MDD5078013.1 50S ribosomal protein L13 [Candidatus Omnitrophota bacterium]MDD5725166.1 50S ribosomal protein L13 [Candidatus Omnitrophota bacterium]